MSLIVPGESTAASPVGRFGKIYQIEAPRAPLNPAYRLVLPHRYLFPRTAIQRIITEEGPDLLEVSDKYAIPYLAGLLRTRRLPGVNLRPAVVGMSHERMDENVEAYLSGSNAARAFCKWYMKWLYFPMFDHHITVSEHTAEELIEASRGHKVARGIWVAPMGVDCDTFTPQRKAAAPRRQLLRLLQGNEHSRILFYAGRLVPEKNLPLLLEIMELLDPAVYRLAIAGAGIHLEYLQRECARRKLGNVAFLGHIGDRETLAGYYANADVFVHPNPREPYGIGPLEAMASGVPLVAPNAGGVTSYANASNAWLADANAGAFADAVRAVQEDSPGRLRKLSAARAMAETLSWPSVAERYLRLYRELGALTQGIRVPDAIEARTWSTHGNVFGREPRLL